MTSLRNAPPRRAKRSDGGCCYSQFGLWWAGGNGIAQLLLRWIFHASSCCCYCCEMVRSQLSVVLDSCIPLHHIHRSRSLRHWCMCYCLLQREIGRRRALRWVSRSFWNLCWLVLHRGRTPEVSCCRTYCSSSSVSRIVLRGSSLSEANPSREVSRLRRHSQHCRENLLDFRSLESLPLWEIYSRGVGYSYRSYDLCILGFPQPWAIDGRKSRESLRKMMITTRAGRASMLPWRWALESRLLPKMRSWMEN